MNCKRAKQELALSAGNDLDPITEQELRRHLNECPECHNRWNRLRTTTAVLQRAAAEDVGSCEPPRLWSSLSGELPHLPPRRSTPSHSLTLGNAWVPLVAVASLFLAVVSIQRSLEQSMNQPRAADFNTLVEGSGNIPSGFNAPQGQPASARPNGQPLPDSASSELGHESQSERRGENGNPVSPYDQIRLVP